MTEHERDEELERLLGVLRRETQIEGRKPYPNYESQKVLDAEDALRTYVARLRRENEELRRTVCEQLLKIHHRVVDLGTEVLDCWIHVNPEDD